MRRPSGWGWNTLFGPGQAEKRRKSRMSAFPAWTYECLEGSGLPLAVMEGAAYEEVSVEIHAGDRLLLFSDGAIEIHNSDGVMLEINGLVSILQKQGYPESDIKMGALEEQLLKYSNAIRLEDNLTLVEVRFVE